MSRISFDSTYEGLKRAEQYDASTQQHRFDSTYEGLKRLDAAYPTYAIERFDSTYEGLKLSDKTCMPCVRATFRQYL